MATDPLFIRLYLDEDFHPDLADLLRRQGVDCQSAAEAGMLGREDEEQLGHATSQGRCLVSFNTRDFSVLAQQWAQQGRLHAGIIVTPQLSRNAFGQLLQSFLDLWNTTTADEMNNVFRYLL
jgi:predicted nuclease of predicted toxin-antitoxin system